MHFILSLSLFHLQGFEPGIFLVGCNKPAFNFLASQISLFSFLLSLFCFYFHFSPFHFHFSTFYFYFFSFVSGFESGIFLVGCTKPAFNLLLPPLHLLCQPGPLHRLLYYYETGSQREDDLSGSDNITKVIISRHQRCKGQLLCQVPSDDDNVFYCSQSSTPYWL